MEMEENLFKEDMWSESQKNNIEDIQEKTGFYLTELFAYFDEENQERTS